MGEKRENEFCNYNSTQPAIDYRWYLWYTAETKCSSMILHDGKGRAVAAGS